MSGAVVGGVFTVGEWAAGLISGWEEIDYKSKWYEGAQGYVDDVLSVHGIIDMMYELGKDKGVLEAIKALEILGKATGVVGYASDAVSLINQLNYLRSDDYIMEQAIYNYFSNDIWVSSSRELVDAKFEFVMGEMNRLIKNEHVKIVERDGKHYFEAIRGSGKARLAGSGQYSIENAILSGNYKAIMAKERKAIEAWSYPTEGYAA